MQREYDLKLIINGKTFNRVLIDDHYEIKHSKVVNDALILEMVKTLNGRTYEHEKIVPSGWEIYVVDPLYLEGKSYRLIWCSHPGEDCIGVINAFRRRLKYG